MGDRGRRAPAEILGELQVGAVEAAARGPVTKVSAPSGWAPPASRGTVMSERGHRRSSAARCSSSAASAVNSSGSTSGMNREAPRAASTVTSPQRRATSRVLFPRRVAVDDGEALVLVPRAHDVDDAAVGEGRHGRARHRRSVAA